MQATGLLRLVGGKVTKKNAATINTNVATVGIRGGIVIVDSDAETTSAAFVYGQEMEVIPLNNEDGRTLLTEDGFVVEVNDPYDDIDNLWRVQDVFLGGNILNRGSSNSLNSMRQFPPRAWNTFGGILENNYD